MPQQTQGTPVFPKPQEILSNIVGLEKNVFGMAVKGPAAALNLPEIPEIPGPAEVVSKILEGVPLELPALPGLPAAPGLPPLPGVTPPAGPEVPGAPGIGPTVSELPGVPETPPGLRPALEAALF